MELFDKEIRINYYFEILVQVLNFGCSSPVFQRNFARNLDGFVLDGLDQSDLAFPPTLQVHRVIFGLTAISWSIMEFNLVSRHCSSFYCASIIDSLCSFCSSAAR